MQVSFRWVTVGQVQRSADLYFVGGRALGGRNQLSPPEEGRP